MSAFSQQVTPVAAFVPGTPLVTLGFEPGEWVLRNDGATAVEFSFDGVNIHGQLPAGTGTPDPTEGLVRSLPIKMKVKKLWLQDGAGTGSVRVEARNL